jgi:hypothetical protein
MVIFQFTVSLPEVAIIFGQNPCSFGAENPPCGRRASRVPWCLLQSPPDSSRRVFLTGTKESSMGYDNTQIDG